MKKCSVTCGSGYKFKYYKCLDIRTNKLADSIKCMNIPKPESVYIKCDQPCYNWQTSSWKPVLNLNCLIILLNYLRLNVSSLLSI